MVFRPCAYPPTSETLREALINMIDGHEDWQSDADWLKYTNLCDRLKKYSADANWLLGLCGILCPELPFFRKDFVPKGRAPGRSINESAALVEDHLGFFSGLPDLPAS